MTLPVPGDVPAGVVPSSNGQLGDILRQIYNRLSEAERKTLYSAVISSGGLTIQDGGAFRSVLPNGVITFYVGPLIFGGVNYNGIIMRRADGTPLFYTFPINDDPDTIAWRFLDHLGNELIASDAATGGLARPWIPLTGVPVLSSAIPMTSSASYVSTWSTGSAPKQQPYAELQALIRSESGGVGTARFTINGTPVGATMPIAPNDFAWQAIQTLALPGEFFDYVVVELEVLRSNGVGTVGGVMRGSQCQT